MYKCNMQYAIHALHMFTFSNELLAEKCEIKACLFVSNFSFFFSQIILVRGGHGS